MLERKENKSAGLPAQNSLPRIANRLQKLTGVRRLAFVNWQGDSIHLSGPFSDAPWHIKRPLRPPPELVDSILRSGPPVVKHCSENDLCPSSPRLELDR